MTASARRQQHDHLAAFKARFRLDLAHLVGVVLDALQQLVTKLLMGHFAAAEAQGDLDLVAFLEKTLHGAHFHLVIVIVDHRAELDLLDLDDLLFLARFSRFFLRLELILAVIQDFGDWRHRIWGDLNQIKPGGLGKPNGSFGQDNAFVVTGGIDQLNLAGADLLVDARAAFFSGQRGFLRTTNG